MTVDASQKLLTVLIPNHNYARYIGKAIDSVLSQDYPAIELIVVDDGSHDNSVSEINKIFTSTNTNRRKVVIPLKNNVGKLGAINAALDEISGEYLIILDADDWLEPGYGSQCIEELEKRRESDPSLGFIYSDCNLMDQKGNYLARGRSVSFDPDLVGKLSYLPEPALMLTESFKEAAPFDESIRVGTKHHKWSRMVENGWTGYHIAEPLFYYRMHTNNLSGIGLRIMNETERGEYGERILSGYWGLSDTG